MDRSWILKDDRVSKEYMDGIKSFVKIARNHLNENEECRCPYRRCVNRSFARLPSIQNHLMRFGFSINYDVWVCHGEKETARSSFLAGNTHMAVETETNEPGDDEAMRFLYEELIRGDEKNASEQPNINGDNYSFLGENTEKLYPGFKFSSLEVVIRLLHIKVMNRWTDKSFDLILSFMKIFWPDLKRFPSSTYEAKKRLRDVGLGYEKIDVCKNDCSVFWKEHANDDHCYVCGESRYKVILGLLKKIPHKLLRYLRLTSRPQRLFGSRHTATDMRWHKEKRDQRSDALRHPTDGEAWKNLD